MSGYIDFHCHAFPDAIATTAVSALERNGSIQAYLDGTVKGLLASMDEAGIAKSVVCSIATRFEQFQPILDWSLSIRSDRIIPFPSVHPLDPHLLQHLQSIVDHGFKGIKIHPYFQDFFLDDRSLNEFYNIVSDTDLMVVAHTGYDIGFPRVKRADPAKVLKVLKQFPNLRFIATHMGGWDDWDDVREILIGRPIYMELSFALDFLDQIRIRDMLLSHPPEYILFGTDSPWADQKTTLKMLRKMNLPDSLFQQITVENATKLLS